MFFLEYVIYRPRVFVDEWITTQSALFTSLTHRHSLYEAKVEVEAAQKRCELVRIESPIYAASVSSCTAPSFNRIITVARE